MPFFHNYPGAFGAQMPSGDKATHLTRYRGVKDSITGMKANVLSARGAMSPVVRFQAEDIVKLVSAKDYLSEILAIRHWVNLRIPYLRDPSHVEWIRDPERLVVDIKKNGIVRADCDEYASLVAALWLAVGNEVEFVTAGFGPPGTPHSHVFARAKIPKTDLWIVCDPVAGTREMQMLQKVTSFDTIPLN